ncbi:MAG: NADH-ubiquinone/plastoquinone oxidoreductase subunit 6 [Anaerolineales bacterium]|nr:NADH-ubiquinone/plastoquinone oxidoreductase subunit 6 [Anaerolineales bacterium]
MTIDQALFFGLAAVAVWTAACMLLSRNAVYSALFLVLNFMTVAVFFLLLHAAFIALMQVTVYAGAIMVLFLFVIMLLGAERIETQPSLPWQAPVAVALTVLLLGLIGLALLQAPEAAGLPVLGAAFGSPTAVGDLLFSDYVLPFEVTSLLLLVAMVGAIVLTRRQKRTEAP